MIGIREVPIINFYGKVTMLGIFKPNGLSCEPSHSARILTILYWGYLTLTEIINGTPINFKHTWTNHTYVTISFWFSMITMGSALAMIGCILILCTFFKRNISLIFFGIVLFFVVMNLKIDNTQLERVQSVYSSMFSEDIKTSLLQSEGSGAVRIMPIVNTFTNLDLFKISSWVGQGNIQKQNVSFTERVFSEYRYLGDISEYGLITYLWALIFVYRFCIRRFFSMESLLFLCLATFSIGSVYYTWLMLIIFCIIKYYSESYIIK